MKKVFTIMSLVALFANVSMAQLADGSIAPDWTLTDINGQEHHLYDYLDNGYTVVIDFSATWCGPCWNYHNTGALEELYMNHGPAGMPNVSANTTDDVMVIFIEGDASTNSDDLNGTGSNTVGDWVSNTPYPIIDDASVTGLYEISFWPTIYTICEDRTITVSGQATTETHYAGANVCAIASLPYQVENTSASTILGVDSNTEFTLDVIAGTGVTEDLRITLSSNEPADWSSSIADGTSTDAVSIDLTVVGDATVSVLLDVTPGTSAALVDYTIEIESLTNPDNIHIFMTYSVIAGITDMVIDNGGRATQWNSQFTSGLDAAGSTAYGVVGIEKFMQGMEAGQLGEIRHLYYNVAWTFPSFTNDVVEVLGTFLDNGGNLFVSGQDIGWDTWDSNTAANGTPQTKAFYTNYLSADYQGDGSGANSQLNWLTEDFVFGEATQTGINDIYAGNIYPDEINAIDPAVDILHYNLPNKTGGVRVEEDGHKVVYIGIDLAMMDSEEARNQTIQLSHDWFHGLILGTEFDEAFKQSVGQNYPNPTKEFTVIPFENLQEDVDLRIVNLLGQTVLTTKIAKGTANYTLDLSKLNTGLYHCVLVNEKGGKTVLPIEVIK